MSINLSRHLFIVFFLKSFNTFCQEKINGLVVDSEDKPIPFAHVMVPNTSNGTITNQSGQFRLSINSSEISSIKITCIGYQSKVIEDLRLLKKIVLKEDVKLLTQIIVTPRDFAREIVDKAIKNIPKNYPLSEERLRGFLREKVYWLNIGEPIYVAEAVIESVKKSYNLASDKGTVRLIEGRKYEDIAIDSLPTRMYAGPHHTHRFDIVSRRDFCLKSPNSYKYLISDTLRFDGRDLFKIHFMNKRKGHEGFLYILDSTFTVAKAEVVRSKFSKLSSIDRDRKFLKYTVDYDNSAADKKWRINHTEYYTVFDKKKGDLVLESQYATTSTEPNTAKIPYPDRIQFTDIYLEKTGTYDSTFWEDYQIILPEAATEELFKKKTNDQSLNDKTITPIEKKLQVIKKIRTGIAVQYSQVTENVNSISFSNDALQVSRFNAQQNIRTLMLTSIVEYEAFESWFLGFSSSLGFTSLSNSAFDFHISKEINLNPNARPILLSPRFNFGYQQLSQKIGTFKSDTNFEINQTEFDSGSTNIHLLQRGFRILPSVSLVIAQSNRLEYFVSAGYNFQISLKKGLFFDETDQFFLKQKSAFLENGSQNLSIETDSHLFENRLVFSFGLLRSF